jgi:hypothetical protein
MGGLKLLWVLASVIGIGHAQFFFGGRGPAGASQVASTSSRVAAPVDSNPQGLDQPARSRTETIDLLLDSAVRSISGERSEERGSGRGAPVRASSPPARANPVRASSPPARANPAVVDSAGPSGSRVRIPSFGRARARQNTGPSPQSERASSQPGDARSGVQSFARSSPSAPEIRQLPQPASSGGRANSDRPDQNSRFSPASSSSSRASLPAEPAPAAPTASNFGSFAARRANDRVFDPSSNPLGQGKRPRIQQFADLTPSDQESQRSLQPLSNDFLPSCPDATFSYIIPSPTQCDLYYLCEFGNPSKKMCEDGLVFSIDQVKCVPSVNEDCKDRPLLQAPKGSGPCERKNGIFYTNETCTNFVTCRDNTASFEGCAEGLVYDPKQKICAWADEALRPGCLPEDLLGFRCPNPKLTQEQALMSHVHLRFGDHDRHADPKDCRYFFMCLTTGQPRRAGCGRGKVFDREAGICKLAKDVPECANYYGASEPAKGGQTRATDARILRIQEDISRQFSQPSVLLTRNKRYLMEEAVPEF